MWTPKFQCKSHVKRLEREKLPEKSRRINRRRVKDGISQLKHSFSRICVLTLDLWKPTCKKNKADKDTFFSQKFFSWQLFRWIVWKHTSQDCSWPTDLIHAQLDLEPASYSRLNVSTLCLDGTVLQPELRKVRWRVNRAEASRRMSKAQDGNKVTRSGKKPN